MNIMINLDSIDKVKRFIDISPTLNYDLDLISEQYVVDGKSVLGILRLDLSKPVQVNVLNTGEYPIELEEFMVGNNVQMCYESKNYTEDKLNRYFPG